MAAGRVQGLGERIGRVRIVHQGDTPAAGGECLHPAGRRPGPGQGRGRLVRSDVQADQQPQRHAEVLRIEFAPERRLQAPRNAIEFVSDMETVGTLFD